MKHRCMDFDIENADEPMQFRIDGTGVVVKVTPVAEQEREAYTLHKQLRLTFASSGE